MLSWLNRELHAGLAEVRKIGGALRADVRVLEAESKSTQRRVQTLVNRIEFLEKQVLPAGDDRKAGME